MLEELQSLYHYNSDACLAISVSSELNLTFALDAEARCLYQLAKNLRGLELFRFWLMFCHLMPCTLGNVTKLCRFWLFCEGVYYLNNWWEYLEGSTGICAATRWVLLWATLTPEQLLHCRDTGRLTCKHKQNVCFSFKILKLHSWILTQEEKK